MKFSNACKFPIIVAASTVFLSLGANKISAKTAIQTIAQTPEYTSETQTDNDEPQTESLRNNSRFSALKFIGLTANNTLVTINPQGFDRTVRVRGIDGNLQAIDFRPANGLLYGLTDTDNLYTINPRNGQATFVSKLSSSFNGGFQSGFDFNPVVDRLRIVGSNDQNFRTNVDTGEVAVDGALAYVSGDVNAGVDPNITASAYENSVAGATATRLFGIDYDLDVLVLQNPPNAGGLQTVGKLGVNFAPIGGFDVFTDAQGNNMAFALSGSALYSIDLSTGAATRIARVSTGFIGLVVTDRD
jgi:hypothetical protein